MTDDTHAIPATEPKAEYVHVSAPILPTELRGFFENKNIVFIVDYTSSKLKGPNFLSYLTNIQMPSEVVFGKAAPTREDYAEVMLAYLQQPSVMPSRNLAILCAQLVLWAKGILWEHIPYRTGVTQAMATEFMRANAGVVLRWINFLDSSPIYGAYSIEALRERDNPKASYPQIDDRTYVGHNVVNLFTVPGFTELYFSRPDATYHQAFFVPQFEEYMFSSKRLEHWFSSPHNFIGLAAQAIAAGRLDPKDLAGSLNLPPPHALRPPHFGADEVFSEPERGEPVPPVAQS